MSFESLNLLRNGLLQIKRSDKRGTSQGLAYMDNSTACRPSACFLAMVDIQSGNVPIQEGAKAELPEGS